MPIQTTSDAVQTALADSHLAAALHALVPARSGATRPERIDTAIHPDCQMLAHSLRAHGDVNLAVSQYFGVALQQYDVVQQLLESLFSEPEKIDFLDFACGYGRLLRFLVHGLSPKNIHAAEIQPDALAWVGRRYGVNTHASGPAPQDFSPGRKFDLIWAASLFSHLPDPLFGPWLAQLAGHLTDQGVLCLSVHDEALLPPDMRMPDSGLLYLSESENAGLDPEIYGTTFVTAGYVERAIAGFLPGRRTVKRLPRLLAHEQDVYVIAPPERSLTPLESMRYGTRGWLDELRIDEENNTIYLAGWAGSFDDLEFDGVEIRLEDQTARLPCSEPRPRVAKVLGKPGLASSGFSCTLPLPAKTDPWLSICAVGADGARSLVYAGRLQRGSR